MQDAKERPVLLVGSVPLGSSRAVFEAVGTKLGNLIKRIPDGSHWVVHEYPDLVNRYIREFLGS